MINILAADKLMTAPKVYSTMLLWLLAELFENLPEAGDLAKPKLVFFFDEAHLLFNDAPAALLDKIEQVVRLIRSKGVGVYFVTQNPADVPDKMLGQLGNRVQHALRAFCPRDQKAVKAAAETMRDNPKLDEAAVITELGVGEALVSCLDEKGTPGIVERALIVPPQAQIGPITDAERQAIMQDSLLAGHYEKAVDRESAHEILKERAAEKQAGAAARNPRRRLPAAAVATGEHSGKGAGSGGSRRREGVSGGAGQERRARDRFGSRTADYSGRIGIATGWAQVTPLNLRKERNRNENNPDCKPEGRVRQNHAFNQHRRIPGKPRQLVSLLDMDRQQSAALWLETRSDELTPIWANEVQQGIGQLASDWLVIDSAAGLSGSNLAYSLVKQANKLIVPVLPSPFDLSASRDFLKELVEEKKTRNSPCQIGVVGMRMLPRTRAATILEDFLDNLGLPILAYLRETQVYVNAAFEGKSLFDLPHHIAERELEQWEFLQDWIVED